MAGVVLVDGASSFASLATGQRPPAQLAVPGRACGRDRSIKNAMMPALRGDLFEYAGLSESRLELALQESRFRLAGLLRPEGATRH